MVRQARVTRCRGPAVRHRAGNAYMAACGMLARLASGACGRRQCGAEYNGHLSTGHGDERKKPSADDSSSIALDYSDKEALDRQYGAAIAGLIGIGPKDEIEGMIAAQLIAAHNAAMECYRRAMIGEQTFEGHRENLTQANKLSRTYAVLLDVLNRHRGKGQQKVTVEHVHVHAGGQAVVGTVETPGGGDRCHETI
jgi:hypothetical protein